MLKRRRFKQMLSLKERLGSFVHDLKKRADKLPPGPAKDDLLRKARHADTALHLDEWANSAGLQPPTK
jgi:hypothetical protein